MRKTPLIKNSWLNRNGGCGDWVVRKLVRWRIRHFSLTSIIRLLSNVDIKASARVAEQRKEGIAQGPVPVSLSHVPLPPIEIKYYSLSDGPVPIATVIKLEKPIYLKSLNKLTRVEKKISVYGPEELQPLNQK